MQHFFERYGLFAEPWMPIDLELGVYTSQEFIAKARQGDRFAAESLEVGIPLYDEQFFNDIRKCSLFDTLPADL
jgi:hypothetical protein